MAAELDRNPRDKSQNRITACNSQDSRKRDREKDSDLADQNLSDDLIKLFAKRYIAENPEKVREVILERIKNSLF